MVKVISQETFDAVVQENMEEFDMDKEEAIKEAIEQFKSQGVDLSNVVTESTSADHPIVRTIAHLKSLDLRSEGEKTDLSTAEENCNVLGQECSKGLAEKVLATKEGGYEILVSIASASQDLGTKESAIRALASLLEGNPDPLDESGFKIIAETLKTSGSGVSRSLAEGTLLLTLNCCVRHEQNRQNLVKHGLLDLLDNLIDPHPVDSARIWQALVQDDDVRVPFGKAHDHARAIVEDHKGLEKLNEAIKGNYQCHKDLALLLSCMSSLCVRNEYCQFVVDGGALQTIFKLLMNPDQKREVVKECLQLIKILAGNDNVKRDVANSGGIVTIINAINTYMGNPWVCHSGCGAISALCLRTPENSAQVMESGGAQTIVQILKTHMEFAKVMVSACSAIRNIVSRSKNFCQEFVDLDIEEILNEILARYPESIDAVKAALRDLDLKVQLNEEWGGVDSIKLSN